MPLTSPRRRLLVSLLALWMALISPAEAQTVESTQNLFPEALRQLEASSPNTDVLQCRKVRVSGQEFTEALEAKTLQNSEWPYSIQVQAPLPVATRHGDVVLAEFWIRTIASAAESGEAKTEFAFEQKGGSFKKSITYEASAGSAWKKYQIPFRIDGVNRTDYKPGEAQICFRLGYRLQTIQLAGVKLTSYGPNQDIQQLPMTRLDYVGREPEATWRREAYRRIEELRKAPLEIRVVDRFGQPMHGAHVEVRMKRHAFVFGTAIDLRFFMADTSDAQRYRQFVFDHFNQVSPANDLKWPEWENPELRANSLAALTLLQKKGQRIRGHCLIWPGVSHLPKDVVSSLDSREKIDARIAAHFKNILTQTRGLIEEWDVVNEPYAERDILNRHGDRIVGDWFKLAHAIDPTPKLFLNDYANFSNNGDNTQHKDDFEKRIRDLLEAGSPVQGIGMQGHIGAILCPPEAVVKELDRFAKFGLPIQITEFDIDAMDDKAKTDYTRDFLIACFSHPAVQGVNCWGFWEGNHWKPSSAMVRKDWSLTPWGQAWFDLVETQWRTSATGVTDQAGTYQIRGFLGDYDITVRANGQTTTSSATLQKKSTPVRIQFPE